MYVWFAGLCRLRLQASGLRLPCHIVVGRYLNVRDDATTDDGPRRCVVTEATWRKMRWVTSSQMRWGMVDAEW